MCELLENTDRHMRNLTFLENFLAVSDDNHGMVEWRNNECSEVGIKRCMYVILLRSITLIKN